MDHPYRAPKVRPATAPAPIVELRRARAALVMLVCISICSVTVFAVCTASLGVRFALSVPSVVLLVASCALIFLALSIPFEGAPGPTGLVLRFLYGTRAVSWEDYRHGRRSVLDVDLLGGEAGLVLIALKVRRSPTRLCLLALRGWRTADADPWSPDSYETSIDGKLHDLESTAARQPTGGSDGNHQPEESGE